MPHYPSSIEHSRKYEDAHFQFKHVKLTREAYKAMPKGRLLDEDELAVLGVTQRSGWQHYFIFKNEPHVLLFRRRRDSLEHRQAPFRLI